MATFKVTEEGRDGTVKLLPFYNLDFRRFFYFNNCEEIMNQPIEPKEGLVVLPAFVDVTQRDEEGNIVFQKAEEVLVLGVFRTVDDSGAPSGMLEIGDELALFCIPFEHEDLRFELRKI